MTKMTNRCSPEVRERAVRMLLNQGRKYPSRRVPGGPMTGTIGGSVHTLMEWLKRAVVEVLRVAGNVGTD